MDVTWLLLSMFYSMVGFGMFLYGKRADRLIPAIAGMVLMVLPPFIGSVLWMSATSIVLMASPFLLSGWE